MKTRSILPQALKRAVCRRWVPALLAVALAPALVYAEGPQAPGPGTRGPEARNPPPVAPVPAPPSPEAAPHGVVPPPSAHGAEKPGQHGGPDGKEAASPDTPSERAKLLDELYARLATAPDEATGSEIATAIEQLWQHSGSPTADLLVARAMAAIDAQKRALAMKLLNAAVELQPDYAEAWNRRAYLFYMEDESKRALGDIRRVLALEPRHFKALEGLANILQGLGEKKAALEAYESLLKIYPTMPGAKKARDDLKEEVEGQGI